MEILVVILAELMAGFVLPFCLVVICFFGLIFQVLFLILEFFFDLFRNRKGTDSKTPLNESTKDVKRTVPKRRLHKVAVCGSTICLLILAAPIVAYFIANGFVVSSVVRMVLVPIEKKTDYQIRFEKAQGDLFNGKIELENVSVLRNDHPVSQVNLMIKDLMINISWSDLKEKRLVFEKVRLDHISGRWVQLEKPDKLKPRREYLIHDLELNDVLIDFEDQSNSIRPFNLALRIDSATINSMRSDWAIYDFLSRSNLSGAVNDIPFQISSTSDQNQCRMSDIPADQIFAFTGNLLNFVDTGYLDVQVIQRPLPQGMIDMEWSILLRDYAVRIPDGGNNKIRMALVPLQMFMKEKSKDLPVNFRLQLDEKIFRYSSSEEFLENIRLMIMDYPMKKIPWDFH